RGAPYTETQTRASTTEGPGRVPDLAQWEVPTASQGTGRRDGVTARRTPPRPSVDPAVGGGMWAEPGSSRHAAPGHPADGRYSDPLARREPFNGPMSDETGFDDSETELGLAAWLNTLEGDHSPDEAGGR
ncbi:MAG: hypothetical protein M3252_03080, partial [Actinomycetota bacterium]|nr:hypothetical protein [Actinomycetota bacterium]